MKIILVGRPGSGKSEIGKTISSKLDIPYISSGDIAREMAIKDERIKVILDNGGLAPEESMRSTIKDRLSLMDNFILDGFPRNIQQLELLYSWFRKQKLTFVNINCNTDISIERMMNRDRSDNNGTAIRLTYYDFYTKDMIAIIPDKIEVVNNSNNGVNNISECIINYITIGGKIC